MLKATATNAEGAAPVDFAVGIKSGDVKVSCVPRICTPISKAGVHWHCSSVLCV